jgi:flagellar basal-body rod protein FlgB
MENTPRFPSFSKTGTQHASPFMSAGWPIQLADTKENAMSGLDGIFGIHATALQLRQQRMGVLASNIANAATPNYKARDLDFGAALKLAEGGQGSESAVKFRIPTQTSLDGNTVELQTEQVAFAENALAYRSTLSFLQGRISQLTRALRGE